MNGIIEKSINDSARDFQNIVWPIVKDLPLIGGGDVRIVEANTSEDFCKDLDRLAGIDAWHISSQKTAMRSLASRVQWGAEYNSFSIRYKAASGARTEYDKRISAINSPEGWAYPAITIQAFLGAKGGPLLTCAAVLTTDLFGIAEYLVDSDEIYDENYSNEFGIKRNVDGSQFIYLNWDFLIAQNILSPNNACRMIHMFNA